MARKALADACDYARQRHAFGRPIGSYQGLAHPLADSSVDVDGASLLIWRTVEAIGLGNSEAAAMVSMSAWWASQVCLPATIKAMRVFGGFGMTMELNAQLFFRRVTAAALTMGDPARELQRVGRRLWGSDRDPPLPAAGNVEISFEPPESTQTPVDAARLIFKNHITDERRLKSFSSGDGFDPELYYALARDGLLFPDWPEEYGGGGHSSATRAAVRGVYAENGWSDTIISVADMVGQLIINYGSDRAKLDILPKLASGEAWATLCFTEPSCGSDVFAAQTRAVQHGSDWIIDGQKSFTSQGHLAQYGLMLARTGDAAKHDSITLFVLPLSQPGYVCHPIETIGGERTNTTFYENMRVPDDYRLGEVNGGAKVLASALTLEHGSADLFVAALGDMLDAGLSWTRNTVIDGKPALDNPEVLAALASVATRLAITDVLNRRTVWAVSTANHRKHYGPSAKLFGSESWKSSSLELMNLTAPDSLFQKFDALGRIEKLFRRSVPSTIYAGTSEIQRSLIVESSLGLPRSRS
jgi:alkylation response protein AidB-like acyl-CoA dehydrogenase